MKATLPGTCACGCRRPIRPGDQIERASLGWVLSACRPQGAPRAGPAAQPASGSPEEVRQVLAEARAVARRADAAAKGGRR